MDMNRDELRRELKAIDADNKAIMPKWYDALRRIVGGGTTLSTDEKAALLGVPAPGRRQLFKLGGATLIGAAVLAACGDDEDSASTTTTAATTTSGGDGGSAAGGDMDAALARTAASLEKLAVDTYQVGIDSGLVTTAAIGDAAKLFQAHHQAHLDALNGAIGELGGEKVTTQNEAVFKSIVEPAVKAATTEADVVELALGLELQAAQTYVFAAGALSVPALRSTIMTIGSIETRHAVVLQMAAQGASGLAVFPDKRAFFPGDNPLVGIDGALLSA
jgi:hypothetical protein